MRVTGCNMRRQLLINVGFNLDYLVVNILPGCKYHRWINLKRYRLSATDDQNDANYLHTPATFLQ